MQRSGKGRTTRLLRTTAWRTHRCIRANYPGRCDVTSREAASVTLQGLSTDAGQGGVTLRAACLEPGREQVRAPTHAAATESERDIMLTAQLQHCVPSRSTLCTRSDQPTCRGLAALPRTVPQRQHVLLAVRAPFCGGLSSVFKNAAPARSPQRSLQVHCTQACIRLSSELPVVPLDAIAGNCCCWKP